jgi:hypothetical protein
LRETIIKPGYAYEGEIMRNYPIWGKGKYLPGMFILIGSYRKMISVQQYYREIGYTTCQGRVSASRITFEIRL